MTKSKEQGFAIELVIIGIIGALVIAAVLFFLLILYPKKQVNEVANKYMSSSVAGDYEVALGFTDSEPDQEESVKGLSEGVDSGIDKDEKYKIKTTELKSNNVEQVVRENNAKVLTVDPDFIVIEKTGHKEEIQVLFEKLKTFGILEFARSGRVAVTKPMKDLTSYLKEFEKK